ncbi:MAG: hypothetical protein ACP5I8_15310 [Phycisphaerae bacterium]
MEFNLNKTQFLEFGKAFRKARLTKGKKMREAIGIDRLFARIEATGNSVHIQSGRVNTAIHATVSTPGTIVIRDTLLRSLLENLREDGAVHFVCTPSSIIINGASLQMEAGQYAMYARPDLVPKDTIIHAIPPGSIRLAKSK